MNNNLYAPPENLSAKQDAIIRLVAKYIVDSKDPVRFQNHVKERTQHNHNFGFLHDGDEFYTYYSYVFHSYRMLVASTNDYYDQYGGEYNAQLARHQAEYAAVQLPCDEGLPPPKRPRDEPEEYHYQATLKLEGTSRPPNESDDEDEGMMVVVENGVQRLLRR